MNLDLTTIDDITLPALNVYHQLRDNVVDAQNSFIADSPKVVNLLLETSLKVKSILATYEYYEANEKLIAKKNIPILYVADKALMQRIVGHKIHHNVMMHGIRPQKSDPDELDDQIIMLDTMTSTENIGAIARSAAAVGVNSYVVPKQGPHPYGRRALRVSMGYVSRLKIHVYDDIFETLARLKAEGYTIIAAEVTEDAQCLSQLHVGGKWVLLMGHEGKGLSPEVIAACDMAVQIEMEEGIKSFNVGIAASIMMYQLKQM